ncbi:MAG: aminopeptidase [Verrucomicrobiia bacterium]
MNDPRFDKLARLLTTHSTNLQPGENVLIEAWDIPPPMLIALIRAIRARKARPFLHTYHSRVATELARAIDEPSLNLSAAHDLAFMRKMHAYIALRGADNVFESSDIPPELSKKAAKARRPLLNHRINKTKWVVLRWPTPAMAQQAMMSTEAFENLYFNVCTLDYRKMRPPMERLRDLMARTDRVQITGPGTHLTFSIKNIGAVICGGDRNIPDGEVYSCPVKTSVEGHITFNTPSIYRDGTLCENVRLDFSKGKIIQASASKNQDRLNDILDTDPGARFIGEFSLGFNPYILQPIGDILFDEKIAGSFHFTPGQAYEEADNGNRSAVHWDMVSIQRQDFGGGEIHFDNRLIRKDGLFTLPELKALNPAELIKRCGT